MEIPYGKRITHESFFNDRLASKKIEYSVPEVVQDKTQALSIIMKSIDLITSGETKQVILTIDADKGKNTVYMVTKNWKIKA